MVERANEALKLILVRMSGLVPATGRDKTTRNRGAVAQQAGPQCHETLQTGKDLLYFNLH